jgi:hypothetical protein
VLFSTLVGTFNEVLKPYGIRGTVGATMLRTTWAAAAFSLAASFFWLLSVCCCSGRSPYGRGKDKNKRVKVEKTPYTYERVGSPYLGPQAGPSDRTSGAAGGVYGGQGGQQIPMYQLNPGKQQQQRDTGAFEPFRPAHA